MRDTQLFVKKEYLLLFLLIFFYIDPFQKGYYMCFILAFYFLSIKVNSFFSSIDKLGILLILFSISYSIIYSFTPDKSNSFVILYAIAPILVYSMGKYFSRRYRSYDVYYFLFLFLGLGYSLIPAISIINNIIENGFVGERNLKLLTRPEVSEATQLGSYFTMNMATIGTIFVQSATKIENKLKIITISAFSISLLCVLRVASRTQLGIAVISILVTIFYLLFKQSFNKNIRLLLTIVIPLVVIFLYIPSNAAFFNILEERNNDEERIMNVSGRTDLWAESLNNLTTKPFGWEMTSDVSQYSHNLWLDVDRITGIIPFIFLVLYTISCIYLVIKTFKIAPHKLYFNATILVLFIGFMTIFFVEPIIEGMYYLFLIFCLYIGILSGYVKT